MNNYQEIEILMKRSYTFRLIEHFVEEYNVLVNGKIEFREMAQRQEEFDHIVEVFEQDLRLNNEDIGEASVVLKNVLLYLGDVSKTAENYLSKGFTEHTDTSLLDSWLADKN